MISKGNKVFVMVDDKVFVTLEKEKMRGVVIDVYPGSRWASPSYLVMFKSNGITPCPDAGWYDAYRVSKQA